MAGITWRDEKCEDADTSYISSNIPDSIPGGNYTHTDLITFAIKATQNLHLSEDFLPLTQLVDANLDGIRRVSVATVIRIPCSIRPLLSQVLCSVLRAVTHSVWGFVQLALFPKAVLRASPQHSPPKREIPKSLLKSCLKVWQSQGGIIKLWEEIQGLPAHSATSSAPSVFTTRALHWARLGRLGNAIKAISSSGVADPKDSSVQAEILKRNPDGPVLLDADLPDLSPAITVIDHLVLRLFLRVPALVASNLEHNIFWMLCLALQLQCPKTAYID